MVVNWKQSADAATVAVDAAKAIRSEGDLAFYDAKGLWIEGRAWNDTKDFWNRLPAKAEGKVTPAVWTLQSNTAGIAVRFFTDSKRVTAIWSGGGAMNHMAASGVSGLDLYRRQPDGAWDHVATGRPKEEETTAELVKGGDGALHEYLLFLPLYHGVTKLELGIDKGAKIESPTAPSGPPIVFYGTSITQGGCASRTGMAHPAILRRWLDREVVNLGMSGAGKMEPIMQELLAEIDASVYILDCLPNLSEEEARERLEPFIRNLRKARPDTPILLAGHIKADMAGTRNAFLREVRDRLRAEGFKKLYYVDGPSLIAGEEEGTVDGIHPTDLGFYRMAQGFRAPLQAILNGDESRLDWP